MKSAFGKRRFGLKQIGKRKFVLKQTLSCNPNLSKNCFTDIGLKNF